MKKAFNIIALVAGLLLLALCTGVAALHTSAVQTRAVDAALRSFEKGIEGDISFEKLHIRPFNTLILKNVVITDKAPWVDADGSHVDTLFKAEDIVASFSLKGLKTAEGLHARRTVIKNGMLFLVNDERGDNLSRIFHLKKSDPKPRKQQGDIFDISRAELRNFHFKLVDYVHREANAKAGRVKSDYGIDWNDIDLFTDIKGHSIRMSGGYMSGVADRVTIREKSGLEIEVSGKAKVGHGQTIVKNIKIKDSFSDINMPLFSMAYDNSRSFKNFLQKVRLTGELGNSSVNFKTISWFAPSLKDMTADVEIVSALVDGPVSNLGIADFSFHEKTSGVNGNLSLTLSGLPDAQGMVTKFNTPALRFTMDGLGKFVKALAPGASINLEHLAPGKMLVFTGSGHGPLNHLSINGGLKTEMGKVSANANLDNLIRKDHDITMKGRFTTEDFDISQFLGKGVIHETSLRASASAVLSKGAPQVSIDTLVIDRLRFNGYDYSSIIAAGDFSQKAFDGKVISGDPNLNFIFQGLFNFSPKSGNALYKFYANLGYADLNALNFDKRGTSKLSLRVNANYMLIGSGDAIGEVDVRDVSFESQDGFHNVGDISVSSHSNDKVNRIKVESNFAEGSYVGTAPIGRLLRDVEILTTRKEFPLLYKEKGESWSGNTGEAVVHFHDSRDILAYVLPGLYIADSTSVKLSLDNEGIVSADIMSPRLAFKDNYLKNLDLGINNGGSGLIGKISSSQALLGGLNFLNSSLDLSGADGDFTASLIYDNKTPTENKGDLRLQGSFSRNYADSLIISAQTLPSSICYEGKSWKILPAKFTIAGGSIAIDSLIAECSNQSLRINGGLSKYKADTLSLQMNDFDIRPLGMLLNEQYGIKGLMTGTASLASPLSEIPDLRINIGIDSTQVGGRDLGRLILMSFWNEGARHFDLLASNDLDDHANLKVQGFYLPDEGIMDIGMDLDALDAGCLSPILSNVFTGLGGGISGHIRASGTFKDIRLSSSNCRFDNLGLTLDYTKVPYFANGPFHITTEGLFFDSVNLSDRYDGKGIVNGKLSFGGFKKPELDVGISMDRIEALCTKEGDIQSFYGNVFASGSVILKGGLNALAIDINASTQKTGTFNIPMGQNASIQKSNLLSFNEKEKIVYIDPYEEMMARTKKEQKSANDLTVKMKIKVDPGVEGRIIIDREIGNQLTCNGVGDISLDIRPSRDIFTIIGAYNPNSGNLRYSAMNIATRNFTLQDGGSIKFNGNIMDSDLDVTALYTTKTSLSTLLADTSAVATRQSVTCGITLTDKLRNPRLSLSISVPNLDPTTQAQVESALNTEDKLQKQFLSLLISNSFLPNEESGIVNNNNMLLSNVAEIMAGQLNNILQKLDIPLDLGLNYQTNNSGANILDVAVSTQLFNNRVVINGAIGNHKYGTSLGGTDEVVGDLDIDVKLNRQGNIRLNLFSHSADQYTIYLDNSQRNGIGFTFQKDFNRVRDFLRSIFTSKKKREQQPVPVTQENDELNVIKIEK